jgi:hypothetical protein
MARSQSQSQHDSRRTGELRVQVSTADNQARSLARAKFQYHQFGLDMLAENLTQRGASFLMNVDIFSEATRDSGTFHVVSEM